MPDSQVWVKLSSGREINVAPLLQVLEAFDHPENSVSEGALNVISSTIKTLNLSEHNHQIVPAGKLVDLYYDLHLLKDAFSTMTEREVARQI